MTATINDCLAQLQSTLQTALVPAEANKVYGYRTWPDKLDVSVSLTYLGGSPSGGTTGGRDHYYDFSAVLGAKHNNTEATLEAAEEALNDVENVIVDTLYKSKNSLWFNCDFPRPSSRPPSPFERPKTRFGEVFIRVYLR
jgi:hypothetical protein